MDAFRHIALMYAGLADFVEQNGAFLREGIEREEPTLVMVGPEKIEALRDDLGDDAHRVYFIDMTKAGRNPAWIIPAWREFANGHPDRRLRGIGEPIWAGRTPDELVECQRHESLLNHAFADADGFTLLCPYDTDALSEAVIEEARRSHPCLAHAGEERASDSYRGVDACATPFAEPLPEPETVVHGLPFNADTIESVRRSVARHAEREGLPSVRRDDLVLAVNEIASNSVRHGGGYGRLRVWTEDESVVCEVRDRGAILEPLAGRERPRPGQPDGYGLWLAHQVCDLVQVRALPRGGAVRLHMRRG